MKLRIKKVTYPAESHYGSMTAGLIDLYVIIDVDRGRRVDAHLTKKRAWKKMAKLMTHASLS